MLYAIWAQSRNRVIGNGTDMPWHLPEDLQHFKNTTMGEPVIMGRRTWNSLPKTPLPGRTNIILSHQTPGVWSHGAHVTTTVPTHGWIIGGGDVYAATLSQVTRIERTVIDTEIPLANNTVLAPDISHDFLCTSTSSWQVSRTGLRYRYETWEKIVKNRE